MSNNLNAPPTIRWKLLSTVSALALLTSSYAASAEGTDTDRPLVWVELGGQMDNVSGQGEIFSPPFLAANPNSSVIWSGMTPLQAQQPPKSAFSEEGRISFQPEGSSWIFSAGLRYGRSGNTRHVHHQTYNIFYTKYKSGNPQFNSTQHQNPRGIDKFSDTQSTRRESHAILDFSAGKDVGLGMFGKDSTSTVSLGVRIAQFTSKASVDMRARPDLHFKYQTFAPFGLPSLSLKLPYFQTYHATGLAERSFRGVGPSLSWSGSAPFAGNPKDGELTLDWGANAALLFGKQKAHVHHQQSEHYVTPHWVFGEGYYTGPHSAPPSHVTDRSVTVPNVGGTVGLSWRAQDFKVSLGYRADFFFGAMDGGIDARKDETLGFKGPYASISVGLGD